MKATFQSRTVNYGDWQWQAGLSKIGTKWLRQWWTLTTANTWWVRFRKFSSEFDKQLGPGHWSANTFHQILLMWSLKSECLIINQPHNYKKNSITCCTFDISGVGRRNTGSTVIFGVFWHFTSCYFSRSGRRLYLRYTTGVSNRWGLGLDENTPAWTRRSTAPWNEAARYLARRKWNTDVKWSVLMCQCAGKLGANKSTS